MNINWKIPTADVYSIKQKTGYQEQILKKNSEEKNIRQSGCIRNYTEK